MIDLQSLYSYSLRKFVTLVLQSDGLIITAKVLNTVFSLQCTWIWRKICVEYFSYSYVNSTVLLIAFHSKRRRYKKIIVFLHCPFSLQYASLVNMNTIRISTILFYIAFRLPFFFIYQVVKRNKLRRFVVFRFCLVQEMNFILQ